MRGHRGSVPLRGHVSRNFPVVRKISASVPDYAPPPLPPPLPTDRRARATKFAVLSGSFCDVYAASLVRRTSTPLPVPVFYRCAARTGTVANVAFQREACLTGSSLQTKHAHSQQNKRACVCEQQQQQQEPRRGTEHRRYATVASGLFVFDGKKKFNSMS